MSVKTIVGSIILVGVGAFLWWLISPMFIDEVREDSLPPEVEQALAPTSSRTADEDTASNTTSSPTETSSTNDAPSTFIDGPFPIFGTPSHPASGEVEVIYSPEETLVRYKNYDGTNGPDLKVYLATDLEATEFLSLGDARGNKGTLIYGVPLDVDLDDYRYILTWCEAFNELFDYAEIQ